MATNGADGPAGSTNQPALTDQTAWPSNAARPQCVLLWHASSIKMASFRKLPNAGSESKFINCGSSSEVAGAQEVLRLTAKRNANSHGVRNRNIRLARRLSLTQSA
jgi:hypothetical protein